jgi:hypothetical protein
MKTVNKKLPKAFQNAKINDDLKKYEDHPLLKQKKERAIATLKKAGVI